MKPCYRGTDIPHVFNTTDNLNEETDYLQKLQDSHPMNRLTKTVENLETLLREARLSVEREAESNCVCGRGELQCKYCKPLRALLERIDMVLESNYQGDNK